ncbi:MAG TPA: DinB family protein [Blastocatellia bacterium]|nr:DinB family protein [Blastocatellia bacterium]
MDDSALRENLVELLRGGHAHVAASQALKDINPQIRNARAAQHLNSIWEELEHMRIAQEDILRYTLDEEWESPDFPSGYWPAQVESVSDEMWNATVEKFFSDLEELIALAQDKSIDLTAKIPHGEGRTYLREILLAADHNAYHLGQIVQARKLLSDWPE